MVKRKLHLKINDWPIDENAGYRPDGFKGWPNDKKFALVLTHDVETDKGQSKCKELADLEIELGFRSSFNFVPERYSVSTDLRKYLSDKGFEIGVHGLYHDGKLYRSRAIFLLRAQKINGYLREWNSVGFRSPSMHNNLDWIHDLNIKYDASTFDTDPFEPHSHGTGTIFPFWVEKEKLNKGYIELSYTLPQDFTLFILMQERTIDIWKNKIDWIAENGGMALFNVHPDYIEFNGEKLGIEEYPVAFYKEILVYILEKYGNQYWHVLPKEMAEFWVIQKEGMGRGI